MTAIRSLPNVLIQEMVTERNRAAVLLQVYASIQNALQWPWLLSTGDEMG